MGEGGGGQSKGEASSIEGFEITGARRNDGVTGGDHLAAEEGADDGTFSFVISEEREMDIRCLYFASLDRPPEAFSMFSSPA